MNHLFTSPIKHCLCLLLFSSAAFAHDTWLQADKSQVAPGATVEFDLTSAAGFHGLDTAIQPTRMRRAFGTLAGESFHLVVGTHGEKSLRLSTTPTKAGIATVGIELKPRSLELAPEKIEEYFEEIHAAPELRAKWDAIAAPKLWREVYTKFSKTFFTVGKSSDDKSWSRPLGFALELVPEKNPTQLKVGDIFSVRAVKSGVPFAGFTLGFVSENEASHAVVVTDAQGRASARLDKAGRWLVHGTDLRRSAEANLEWESDFVTLVVDVK